MTKTKGELRNILNEVLREIKNDWLNSPYLDKFVSYYNIYDGENSMFVDYYLEKGNKIRFMVKQPNLEKESYVAETIIYRESIGIKIKDKKTYIEIKNLLVEITNNGRKRVSTENKKQTLKKLIEQKDKKENKLSGMLGYEEDYFTTVNELNAIKKLIDKLQ